MLKKLIHAPNALVRFVAEKLVIQWLRDGVAGKHGESARRALLAIRGYKTMIGVAIGLAAYVAGSLTPNPDQDPVVSWLKVIGGVLVAAGLIDKAIWTPGRPEFLSSSVVYRLLADNSGVVAAALLAGFAYAAGPECAALTVRTLSLSCAGQTSVLLGLSAAMVYLGVLDSAFLSKTPYQTGKLSVVER